MHHANLPMEMWYQPFGEIITTVTLLDDLTVIELNGKYTNRYEHFFGKHQTLHAVYVLLVKQVQQKSKWTLLPSWKIVVFIVYLWVTP